MSCRYFITFVGALLCPWGNWPEIEPLLPAPGPGP